LEADANELLQSGHYRAAVFMARLQLEIAMRNLCQEFRRDDRTKRAIRTGGANMAHELWKNGRISRKTANRIEGAYRNASKVIHGRPCPSDQAHEIVTCIQRLVVALDSPEPLCESTRVITGFAQVAGGVA
jgi:hypothetical protein